MTGQPGASHYEGHGKTLEEALEKAHGKADSTHGPGWYRVVSIHIEAGSPISGYRVEIEPVP